MSFVFPQLLALLALAPLLVAAYLALLRKRARRAAELSAQGFSPNAATLRLRRRRHVPFVFFLAGLTLLLFALARPQTSVSTPRREGTVILAFDVSNSMLATDLKPTRIAAAKTAARSFIDRQPESVEVGIVAFSDGALITRQPTKDKAALRAAIDRLTPQGGTSLGQGIFTSLNAIAGKAIAIDVDSLRENLDNIDIGYYGSAAVVLLSDGENTSNLDPVELAQLAAVAGVKIYPIGVGAPEGTVVEIDGFNVATALDEDTLRELAEVTDGTYFAAEDEKALADVYDKIDLEWRTEKEKTEVTGIVTAASLVLFVLGAAASLLWFGRLV